MDLYEMNIILQYKNITYPPHPISSVNIAEPHNLGWNVINLIVNLFGIKSTLQHKLFIKSTKSMTPG